MAIKARETGIKLDNSPLHDVVADAPVAELRLAESDGTDARGEEQTARHITLHTQYLIQTAGGVIGVLKVITQLARSR